MHVAVRGRVQGVGFRYFVRERARSLRLAGWVRNMPDGAVEVLASGPAEALEGLRAALDVGPPGARVVGIDNLTCGPVDDPLEPFGILR